MRWELEQNELDWNELSALYRIAPLGEKAPDLLREVFSNSRFKCFVYEDRMLIGGGRALADGRDCSYICDVAAMATFAEQARAASSYRRRACRGPRQCRHLGHL